MIHKIFEHFSTEDNNIFSGLVIKGLVINPIYPTRNYQGWRVWPRLDPIHNCLQHLSKCTKTKILIKFVPCTKVLQGWRKTSFTRFDTAKIDLIISQKKVLNHLQITWAPKVIFSGFRELSVVPKRFYQVILSSGKKI